MVAPNRRDPSFGRVPKKLKKVTEIWLGLLNMVVKRKRNDNFEKNRKIDASSAVRCDADTAD